MSSTNEKHSLCENRNEKIVKGEVKVKSIYLEENFLVVKLNKFNVPKIQEVYLVNIAEKDFQKVSFSSDEYSIRININKLPIPERGMEGNWSFCFKSKLQGYILFEDFTLENKLESAKIVMDLKTFIKDNKRINTGVYIDENGKLFYCQLPPLDYKLATRRLSVEKLCIRNLHFSNTYFKFRIDFPEALKDENIEVILTSRKTKERVTFFTERKANELKCYFKEELFYALSNGRWDVSIEVLTKDIFIQERLKIEQSSWNDEENKYMELEDENSILFYRTKNGNISVVKGKSYNIFREKNQASLNLTRMKKGKSDTFFIKIVLNTSTPLKILNISLKLRNVEHYKIMNLKNIHVKNKNKFNYEVSGELKFQWNDFSPLYWDLLVLVCDQSNHEGFMRVNSASDVLRSKIDANYFKNSIYTKDKIIYPYITLDNSVAFIMREKEAYETGRNSLKKVIAYYLYKILKKLYFDKKDIWLGFEKFSKTAQDNGYAFFSYVDKNKLHNDFYYIIDKNSPDYEKIKSDSNHIIPFMSFKYMLFLYASKLLISSETKRHAYNIRIRSDYLAHSLNQKRSVFLQHGVTGLKKSDVFKKAKGRGNFDLVVATSNMEKEIIKENWNYSEEEIIVTGFSRWDLLTDRSFKLERKKIFVMPTWRSWMEGLSREEFINTDYYVNYVSLLTSDELNRILSTNNLELVFFLHPKFKEYVNQFKIDSDNITVKGFLDIKVNEEIMESSLLISDYSSVTWDMFYLNKPVIFFQFDYDKYEKYEGSYLNMNNDLFGERVLNISDLNRTLKQYVDNNFSIKPRYSKLRQKYFMYNDQENSKRIFEEIDKFYKNG